MKDFLKTFFASMLAIVVLITLTIGIAGVIAMSGKKSDVRDGSYLIIDIHGDILAYDPPSDIITEILGSTPETVHRILSNLEKASIDDRIKGVIVKISSNNSLGAASIEEIRAAIARVRSAGKKVYGFSDSMNRSALYLAAACDSIIVPKSANITFIGMGRTVSYMKGTLDKLGVTANLHKIDEYKSAAETITRTNMSPEAREMSEWIMNDLWSVWMEGMAKDRGISEDRAVELMEHALFLADEAQEAGLVDAIMYWDELEALLKEEDDKRLRTISQSKYAEVKRSDLGRSGKKTIAIVHAFGSIGGRKSRIDPMWGMVMGHETINKALRRVRRNKNVAAVVFRIDSPGGESLASDLIGREVEVLADEKPVVASMLDVAASGGYHLAYRATKIIADPMTITGSIGSITGKFNTRGLYDKIGVTFDSVSKGPNSFFYSGVADFTPEQRERMIENHWRGFNVWLEDVSEKRGIELNTLKTLAMGRVWTGRQAVDNGLVDEIGGLDRAIALAKELADIPADEEVSIAHYPKRKTLMELITSGAGPKMAMQWVLYKFIHEDLAQSIEMLSYEYTGVGVGDGQ